MQKLKTLLSITKALQNHNIMYRWGYPTKLTVMKDGTSSVISSLDEGLKLPCSWDIIPEQGPSSQSSSSAWRTKTIGSWSPTDIATKSTTYDHLNIYTISQQHDFPRFFGALNPLINPSLKCAVLLSMHSHWNHTMYTVTVNWYSCFFLLNFLFLKLGPSCSRCSSFYKTTSVGVGVGVTPCTSTTNNSQTSSSGILHCWDACIPGLSTKVVPLERGAQA